MFNTEGQAIDTTKCERPLAGLCKALTVHDPPQSVTSILYNTLCTLYNTETLQANVSNTLSLNNILCSKYLLTQEDFKDKFFVQDVNIEK